MPEKRDTELMAWLMMLPKHQTHERRDTDAVEEETAGSVNVR